MNGQGVEAAVGQTSGEGCFQAARNGGEHTCGGIAMGSRVREPIEIYTRGSFGLGGFTWMERQKAGCGEASAPPRRWGIIIIELMLRSKGLRSSLFANPSRA